MSYVSRGRAKYLFKKNALVNVKKHAVEMPADPKIMHITIIWYLAAIKGDTPDKICPVIIPGRDTRPTANKELIIGIREALIAILRAV